ncbi:P-type DNA transfer ATPase VirB11 [Xanthomonas hortorum pv. pelargonii]|uniref:P-type DNA transfer ATPase VirB11 n=1 Tax=Xanthomonas hortorum TaxID=56454 RepID=UPI0032E8A0C6
MVAEVPGSKRTIDRDASVWLTLGPLKTYLDDPEVFEVRVNRFGQVVCDTARGRVFHDRPEVTAGYLERLTNTLLNYNGLGRMPINNVLLPDGSRGIICWPPAVLEGTVLIAIRKHLAVNKSLEDLREEGRFNGWKLRSQADVTRLEAFEEELLQLLAAGDLVSFFRLAVRSKRNIAVSGKTGSGKSTFTRTLLMEVPAEERVLLMEDVHEVASDRQHEIGYMMYGSQEGRVSVSECLKACMRLSPDRIFMTELRDDAAWDYLAGANTGHPGGIFSTHADNAVTTPSRIATLVKASEVGRLLDYEVIMKTIHTTLDVIVYMKNRQIIEVLYDPHFKKQQLAG